MNYINEEAGYGIAGHLFVIIAFVSALAAGISYFFAAQTEELSWKRIARAALGVHVASVWGIFLMLLYLLIAHKFQYQYVWQHSSKTMDMQYILACLWEGQEGSTLLWMLWHTVIATILMFKRGKWEAPVIAVIMLVQFFLSMMLLGIYIGDTHIGSNPFLLVRELPQNLNLPWTKLPDYLTNAKSAGFFEDGRGLNPLLQNYWMTIHPPILFLGFALTVVPFAFAISALWKNDLTSWQKPALSWTFTGIAILGIGILMGGAWAYEALSFGGFWAWDPVENASLVPWLTLVGAGHVMLIYRIKGRSLYTTLFLSIITFILILYSTFLTKSGILGETSVHAFTDMGMSGQLMLYLAAFVFLAVMLLSVNIWTRWAYTIITVIPLIAFIDGNRTSAMAFFMLISVAVTVISYIKFFPKEKNEEALWSREFWMFSGAVVFLIAGFQIIFFTSIPVINKFLHIESIHNFAIWLDSVFSSEFTRKLVAANLAPGGDMVYFYNKWQFPLAVIICLLVGFGQYFKYKKTPMREFVLRTVWTFIASLIIGISAAVLIYFNRRFVLADQATQPAYASALFWGCFLVIVSLLLIIFSGAYNRMTKKWVGETSFAYTLFISGYVLAILYAGYKVYGCFDAATSYLTPESSKAFVIAVWAPVLLFAATFAILSNADYLLSVMRGKIRSAGASIAHIGFALLLLGALISTSRKQVISQNTSRNDLTKIDSSFSNENNILITQGDTLPMGDYYVTYSGREKDGIYVRYNVDYFERENGNGPLKYSFRLKPFVQLNQRMGNAAEPDTRHYLHKDVYTHIIQADLSDPVQQADEWLTPKNNHIKRGDTIALSSAMLVFDSVMTSGVQPNGDISVGARFSVYDQEFEKHTMIASFTLRGNQIIPNEERNDSLGLKLSLWKVYPADGSFDMYVSEKKSKRRESIVMQAVVFPGINILWLGCIVMFIGTVLAVLARMKQNRQKTGNEKAENV